MYGCLDTEIGIKFLFILYAATNYESSKNKTN